MGAFTDYNGISTQSAQLHFVPMTLSVPGNPLNISTDPNDVLIRFVYDASDANPLSLTHATSAYDGTDITSAAAGIFRIWRRDGYEARSLSQYIKPNAPYSLTQLGMSFDVDKTFYIEAVRASAASLPITVSVDLGSGVSSTPLVDTIFAKPEKRKVGAFTQIDSYIPNTLGDPPANSQVGSLYPNVNWGVAPGQPGAPWNNTSNFPTSFQAQAGTPAVATVFATDDRATGSQTGSYRTSLRMNAPISANQVGIFQGTATSLFDALSGRSYEAEMSYVWNHIGTGANYIAGAYMTSAQAIGINVGPPNPPTKTFSFTNSADGLSTQFILNAQAHYPFSMLAPDIDIDLKITFSTNYVRDTVWVSVSGTVDNFPQYALYRGQGQTMLMKEYLATGLGPTLINLNTTRAVNEKWIV